MMTARDAYYLAVALTMAEAAHFAANGLHHDFHEANISRLLTSGSESTSDRRKPWTVSVSFLACGLQHDDDFERRWYWP